MSHNLRIALFVEGGDSVPSRDGYTSLTKIWSQQLQAWLALLSISRIIPISKKTIIALDPAVPAMSGAGEALDQLIVRELARQDFDVALIAWDLAPPWDPEADMCRWQETLDLYKHLSKSSCLEAEWRSYASTRHAELSGRKVPSARVGLPELRRGAILPLCMTPEFERLLVNDERIIRKALGVLGRQVKNWPTWDVDDRGRGNTLLLQKAILASRRTNSKSDIFRKIRGDMRTAKDDWCSHFLRYVVEEQDDSLKSLELPARLFELLGRHRCTE